MPRRHPRQAHTRNNELETDLQELKELNDGLVMKNHQLLISLDKANHIKELATSNLLLKGTLGPASKRRKLDEGDCLHSYDEDGEETEQMDLDEYGNLAGLMQDPNETDVLI